MAGYRIPGPLGTGSNTLQIDSGTSARITSPLPGPIGTDAFNKYLANSTQGGIQIQQIQHIVSNISEEQRILSALSYGEASTSNVFEEMAAIANVIVRQAKARGKTVSGLIKSDPDYSYAANDGNQRYNLLMKASISDIEKDAGMSSALKGAENALTEGTDYSNGGYFWDGADIKTNYRDHPKVKKGIKFTKPGHNIYKIAESSVDVRIHWQAKDKTGKLVDGKERGRYTYTFESTAAYGGTIFWKYSDAFLNATSNKVYK